MSAAPPCGSSKVAGATPLGGVVLRTLADHRPFTLIACCGPCGRYVELEHAALARRFGWDATLDELRRRMACRRCGTRTGHLLIAHGPQRPVTRQGPWEEVQE